MSVNIRPGPTIPQQRALSKIESAIGAKFPDQYVAFLAKFGAGDPDSNVLSGDERVSVSRFLTIGADEEYSMEKSLEVYSDRIPDAFFPVAEAAGGNLILMNSKDGSIYFWDHELELKSPNAAVSKVANSFDEFLNLLQPLTDADIPKHEVVSVKVNPDFAKKFGLK